MVVYTYNLWLVALSFLIALMASFTGLALSRGLGGLSPGVRQLRIVLAALAIGGGIWSMHFVAILAMRFGSPVDFSVPETVASALIAILMAGLALLIVHFGRLSTARIMVAGAILGLGITVMHYLGMTALQGCTAVFSALGILLSAVLSVLFGIIAMTLAFGKAREVGTLWASLVFGAAVSVVHFTAMSQTSFFLPTGAGTSWLPEADSQIAIMVMLAVFVISGGFLLVGASYLGGWVRAGGDAPETADGRLTVPAFARAAGALRSEPDAREDTGGEAPDGTATPPGVRAADLALRVPYERDGRTNFVPAAAVYALHADGHYTRAYLDHGPVFCPWSISTADDRLTPGAGFMRVHRGWIVNLALVSAYERSKDHGYCVMAGAAGLERVPVSRNRIAALQKALGF
jgi:NO-binding membrane sensor protein with MHYT domain